MQQTEMNSLFERWDIRGTEQKKIHTYKYCLTELQASISYTMSLERKEIVILFDKSVTVLMLFFMFYLVSCIKQVLFKETVELF